MNRAADQGYFGHVERTPGGHRRIDRAAVEARVAEVKGGGEAA